MIELIKVGKSYPPDVEALSDISLSIGDGEIVFLTGRSGAGKTTLLRLLSRIETPTRGVVEVAGKNLDKLSRSKLQELRRSIGFAFQDFKLLLDRTVAENIGVSMEVNYIGSRVIRRRTEELLEQLGLEGKYATLTAELSRGEQQRVAIARAVAGKPMLLLADEPTGNLDAETTDLVMQLFHQCHAEGATLVIATHDTSIYRDSGHRVIGLAHGRCLVPDTPDAETIPPAEQTEAQHVEEAA